MRSERGFGIVTVMAGAVMLGIFAMVYTQQMQNRANVSLIGDLMSFREQVITYYGSVVSNRSTWECTIRRNSTLQTYLSGGDPTASRPGGSLDIYDYTGDCQEGLAGAGTAKLLIPSVGLQLQMQDHSSLPVYPPDPPVPPHCDDTSSTEHFCLKAEWQSLDADLGGNKRGVEVKLILTANRKNIKNDLDVSFDLADKAYSIYMNRTVASDCSDGRVTGYFPGTGAGPVPSATTAPHMTGTGVNAYMGDAAVVDFDPITGLVACSSRGPLIVPPCYNVSDTSTIGGIKTNPFLSGVGAPGYRGFRSNHGFGGILAGIGGADLKLQCDGAGSSYSGYGGASLTPRTVFKGKCPETGGNGTTAISFFDPHTGISHCSHPNILVEKVDEGTTALNCSETNRYGVVKIRQRDENGQLVGTFQCSSARPGWPSNKGGVEPQNSSYPCTGAQAIRGFSNSGAVSNCVDAPRGRTGIPGPRGLRGERGDPAPPCS